MEITLHAIGKIISPYHNRKEVPRQGTMQPEIEAEMMIEEQYVEGIADIRPGETYLVLFYFHESEEYDLTVPIGGTGPMTGLFSTRSPKRPNGIGVSKVTIVSITGNRIRFSGVDMLDNTPILDIKPYLR